MAKDLTLNVVAKKDSRQLEELAAEFDALNKSVDNNSKSLAKNASFSKTLDAQIEKTKKQVHDLGVEADKTGNVDVFRNLRNAEKNLAGLERLKKQLSTALDIQIDVNGNQKNGSFFGNIGQSLKNLVTGAGLQGTKAGDVFGKGFVGAAGEVLTSGAGAVLAPAAVILADEAAAVVSGALTAGIGAGGLAVGIAGAFRDPAVQTAGKQLTTQLSATFTDIGKEFVGPVEQALSDLTGAARLGSADVVKAFEPLTKAIAPLEKGVEGLVGNALPGLSAAFRDAEPVLEEVGKQLPGLGKAIGDSLGKITNNIGANKAAIQLTFQLVDKTIEGLGSLLQTADNVFAGFLRFVQPIAHLDEKLFGWLPGVGDQVHSAAREVDGLVASLDDTKPSADKASSGAKNLADSLGKVNGEIDSLIGKQLTLDQANDKFAEDLLGLKDQLDANSRSIDQHSLAGLHNRDVLLGMIADAEQARQAAIDHAGGVNASKQAIDQANSSYQAAIDKLVAVAANAGISRDELNKLAGNYQINVLLAIDAIYKSGLAQNVSAHDPNRYGSAGPPKRAAGGPVLAGQPYVVGDGGRPELFVPNVNGTIIPKIPASTPYLTSSAVGRSGGAASVALVPGPGGDSHVGTFVNALVRTGAVRLVVVNGAVVAG